MQVKAPKHLIIGIRITRILVKLTLISRAKQRWRFMSLLRSFGRLQIKLSSSTPLVSCHLYCSYRLIRSLKFSGSKRWDIHCSASLLFTLISSNLVVVDCKYVCFKETISSEEMSQPLIKHSITLLKIKPNCDRLLHFDIAKFLNPFRK